MLISVERCVYRRQAKGRRQHYSLRSRESLEMLSELMTRVSRNQSYNARNHTGDSYQGSPNWNICCEM